MTHFVTIDTETTGLFPRRNDRIVELSAVLFDIYGSIKEKYTTLINPLRDVGPTHIHGISPSDVVLAPTFKDVMPDFFSILKKANVLVGHNLKFDLDFIMTSCTKEGVTLPELTILDTCELIGGKLSECCKDYGIELLAAHSAEADAIATGQLLLRFINVDEPSLLNSIIASKPPKYPSLNWEGKPPVTRAQSRGIQQKSPSSIKRLIRRTEEYEGTQDLSAVAKKYLSLLERILEDRDVTDNEADDLIELAESWGISRQQITELHSEYLNRLIKTALVDQVITHTELEDIRTVGRLIGFGTLSDQVLKERIKKVRSSENQEPLPIKTGAFEGLTVCFTGECTCSINNEVIDRSLAQNYARARGMLPVESVTKKLDILVVSDAASQSGKACKAKRYGIRIITEPEFWRLIGIKVDR